MTSQPGMGTDMSTGHTDVTSFTRMCVCLVLCSFMAWAQPRVCSEAVFELWEIIFRLLSSSRPVQTLSPRPKECAVGPVWTRAAPSRMAALLA